MDSTTWNAGSSQRAPAAPKPATLDLPALQAASRVLQDQFAKDVQAVPDLTEVFNTRAYIFLTHGAYIDLQQRVLHLQIRTQYSPETTRRRFRRGD